MIYNAILSKIISKQNSDSFFSPVKLSTVQIWSTLKKCSSCLSPKNNKPFNRNAYEGAEWSKYKTDAVPLQFLTWPNSRIFYNPSELQRVHTYVQTPYLDKRTPYFKPIKLTWDLKWSNIYYSHAKNGRSPLVSNCPIKK